MTRDEFLTYVEDYNSGDLERIFSHFDPDLTFENFGFRQQGPASFGLLRHLHDTVVHRMEPITILVDGNSIALEAEGQVTALRDMPDLPIGAMTKGETVTQRMFAFYTTAGNKITHVRVSGWPPVPKATAG